MVATEVGMTPSDTQPTTTMLPKRSLHIKADVKADVEPIADVEKIQTKTKTETKTETKSGEPARGARSAPA